MKRTSSWILGIVLSSTSLVACGDDGGDAPQPPSDGAIADARVVTDAQATDAAFVDARVDARVDTLDAQGADAGPRPEDAGDVVDADVVQVEAGAPPTAGFTLSSTQGAGTLWVRATSNAAGSAIVETLYDFGEGAGLAAASTHRYLRAGTYTVRQQVRDAAGQSASTTATVTITPFTPVRFSQTDRRQNMRTSPDGFEVENRSFPDSSGVGVVRTDGAISPGSGVFYFEGSLLAGVRVGGFGVATAEAPLDQGSGGNALSLGYEAYGPLRSAGSSCTGASGIDGAQPRVGFVIDYRGSAPVVHLVQAGPSGGAVVRVSCTMAVSGPLHATYWSERATVGYEGRINTGQDTVNVPFDFTLEALQAALGAAGHADAASVLVPGFGSTRAGRANQRPTVELPANVQVALGQPVTLQGSALDAEDGDLSAQLAWVDTASLWHARVAGTGASFAFTPSALGRHPVEVTATDLDGGETRKTVLVTVTGTLPQPSPVRLVLDETSGEGVSTDGLSATFAGPGKDGVKANQGLYGDFWYFEVQRLSPVRNMGMGLMVAEGSLNPYRFDDVPWSVSLNVLAGVWRELLPYGEYTGMSADTHYGWAVDYRGEHPKVYVLVRGTVLARFDLSEVWTPLYPVLYGNASSPPVAGPDLAINFGATPFAIDARAILGGAGIDTSGLKLGWGVHAQ